MPVYDYQCGKCGEMFEKEHPMAYTGKSRCPACGSRSTVKVFHATGVHFKGSGFYVTDSSKSRASANGEAKSTTPAVPEKPAEPSTNGKADEKKASKIEKKTTPSAK
jgi:putative FmdB family regulatory protein